MSTSQELLDAVEAWKAEDEKFTVKGNASAGSSPARPIKR